MQEDRETDRRTYFAEFGRSLHEAAFGKLPDSAGDIIDRAFALPRLGLSLTALTSGRSGSCIAFGAQVRPCRLIAVEKVNYILACKLFQFGRATHCMAAQPTGSFETNYTRSFSLGTAGLSQISARMRSQRKCGRFNRFRSDRRRKSRRVEWRRPQGGMFRMVAERFRVQPGTEDNAGEPALSPTGFTKGKTRQ